jgi:hypothetical protein
VATITQTFHKDPDAVLDYGFDWTTDNWLATGETVSTHTWTITGADALLIKDSQNDGSTTSKIWLSAGTAGVTYTVSCKITTSASRTDERSFQVRVEER